MSAKSDDKKRDKTPRKKRGDLKVPGLSLPPGLEKETGVAQHPATIKRLVSSIKRELAPTVTVAVAAAAQPVLKVKDIVDLVTSSKLDEDQLAELVAKLSEVTLTLNEPEQRLYRTLSFLADESDYEHRTHRRRHNTKNKDGEDEEEDSSSVKQVYLDEKVPRCKSDGSDLEGCLGAYVRNKKLAQAMTAVARSFLRRISTLKFIDLFLPATGNTTDVASQYIQLVSMYRAMAEHKGTDRQYAVRQMRYAQALAKLDRGCRGTTATCTRGPGAGLTEL